MDSIPSIIFYLFIFLILWSSINVLNLENVIVFKIIL